MGTMRVVGFENLLCVVCRMQVGTPEIPPLSDNGTSAIAHTGGDKMKAWQVAKPFMEKRENSPNPRNTHLVQPQTPALIFDECFSHLFVNHVGILDNEKHVPSMLS